MSINKFRLVTIAAAAALTALTGCSSANYLIGARTNPVSGQPPFVAEKPASVVPAELPEEARARAIYNSSTETLQSLLSYVKLPQTAFEEVRVERVGLTTEISFVSSKKGFFPAGTYLLNKIDRTEDRSGVVFTDLVLTSTRNVLDKVKDLAGQVTIEAMYSAQADGVPVRSIRYRGEFGPTVSLSQDNTTLNGTPTAIRIAKNQPLGNPELAALRAVSLSTFVHGKLGSTPLIDKFVLTTTDQQGPQQRWVSLTVKISPTP